MIGMITHILARLEEINGIVGAYHGDTMPFEQAFALARFYYDFQDTNALIADAEAMAGENPEQLKEIALSLEAETATLLNNIGRLDGIDFRGLPTRTHGVTMPYFKRLPTGLTLTGNGTAG